MSEIVDNENVYIFNCPHCGTTIEVDKKNVNCGIFRCGMYKKGGQIPPHASKQICDLLVARDLIYGCGKPFSIKKGVVSICDYI